jgi:hypothetical protein
MTADETKKLATKVINALDHAAKSWGHAMLLVGYPTDSKVVLNKFPERVQALERFLLEGGIPVGMFSVLEVDEEDHFFYYVLEERARDKWAAPYMEAFFSKMADLKPGEILSFGVNEFKNQQFHRRDKHPHVFLVNKPQWSRPRKHDQRGDA